MKKLLVGTAAVALGLALAAPANAQVALDLGGHFKGYVSWIDQDEAAAGGEVRDLDWLQETEVHFTGETTLDNGLTVGVHVEAETDETDSFELDETYAYFSGAWGRVNTGSEDGAAYLLQVAAPSADSNYDGIRQYVNGFNYTAAGVPAGLAGALGSGESGGLDYDNDLTTEANKLTYLSPVFSGFQVGASYTPDVNDFAAVTSSIAGNQLDDETNEHGEAYEVAARYEGQWDEVGIALGTGYTNVNLEDDTAGTGDDFTEWNVGADLDWRAFGLGVVWTENNNGLDTNDENETWVVGVDYTTGPFKLGASYLTTETDQTGVDVELDRYTGGVVYTYGPGMTFRGSVSFLDGEVEGGDDLEGTSVLLGTQINF